jgi:glycine/D-amino acid oxidase-like deaminating enzyme
MDEFITQNKLDCEWTKRTTYDASLSPEFTAYSANTEAALRAIGGDPEVTRLDGAAAAHATRVDAQAAWRWEAATVNPAQLTMGVHGLCVKTGRYTVCAHAPVTKVDKVHAASGQAEAQKWRISTPKGEIVADKVVWANNAYVAGLCAELEGIVVPVRGE